MSDKKVTFNFEIPYEVAEKLTSIARKSNRTLEEEIELAILEDCRKKTEIA